MVEDILPIAYDHPQLAMDESMLDAEANNGTRDVGEDDGNGDDGEYDVCEDDNVDDKDDDDVLDVDEKEWKDLF